MCDSVHRGRGVSASVNAGITPPRSRHPPEQTPPWEQTPPRADTHPPEQTPTPQSRHPPPRADTHPPGADTPQRRPPGADPPEQTTAYGQRAAGTHPTGMHSCFFSVVEDEEKLSRTERHYNRNTTARGNSFGFHYVSIVIDSNSR